MASSTAGQRLGRGSRAEVGQVAAQTLAGGGFGAARSSGRGHGAVSAGPRARERCRRRRAERRVLGHFGAPPAAGRLRHAGLQNRCGEPAAGRAGTPAMLVTICRPQRAQANPVGGSPNRFGASGPGRLLPARFPAPPAAAPRSSSSSSPLRHVWPAFSQCIPAPSRSAWAHNRRPSGTQASRNTGSSGHCGVVLFAVMTGSPVLSFRGGGCLTRRLQAQRPGGAARAAEPVTGARPRRGSPLVMRDASASTAASRAATCSLARTIAPA